MTPAKSNLTSIPSYITSLTHIPKHMAAQIDNINRDVFWKNNTENHDTKQAKYL